MKTFAAAIMLLGAGLLQSLAGSSATSTPTQIAIQAEIDPTILEVLLQKAAEHWNMNLSEAEQAYENGALTFGQVHVARYQAHLAGGGLIEITLDAL